MPTRTCACMHCPACVTRTRQAMAREAADPTPRTTLGPATPAGWTPPK
ncbi:hypothetical protein [Micromonospora sp. NPDC005652]